MFMANKKPEYTQESNYDGVDFFEIAKEITKMWRQIRLDSMDMAYKFILYIPYRQSMIMGDFYSVADWLNWSFPQWVINDAGLDQKLRLTAIREKLS